MSIPIPFKELNWSARRLVESEGEPELGFGVQITVHRPRFLVWSRLRVLKSECFAVRPYVFVRVSVELLYSH
jgi:hypothetical protein